MSALSFSRSKLVGVEKDSPGILKAHGVLEDNIYCMELDVKVDCSNFKIVAIDGKMNRITTSECHKALGILQNAVGMDITDREFARTVNRVIGRAGCLHFGALLTECCDSILQAALFSDVTGATLSATDQSAYAREKAHTVPNLANSCRLYSSEL